MKALLLAAALTLTVVPAALAAETEGEGVNVRHVKNIPHTEVRNPDQANQGTDLEFATITTVPAEALPTANRREGKNKKTVKRCKAKARKRKTRKARRKALRRCAKRARARTADAEPQTPGIQRTFAFAGSYYDGVDIIDVTDPANATRVAHYDCGIGQGDVQVFERDGRHYLLYADDAYDVYASQCTAELPGRTFEEGSAAEDGGGAYVVDVTDPYHPRTVSFIPIEQGSHNLTIHPGGRYLYNSNADLITSVMPAIEIVDLADLTAPKVVGEFALETYPGLGTESHDIGFSADGTRAYVAALSHGEILDTTDPANPARVATVLDPAINVWHQAEEITVGGRSYLIAEDEFAGAEGTGQCPNGAVHVYDITDETSPTKVGAFQIDQVGVAPGNDPANRYVARCTAHVFQVHRDEQLLVMGWYNAGVRVLDLSELEGYRIGENGTGGIRQLGYFTFPDTDAWAAKAVKADRDGFHFFGNDKRRGFDVYEYAPGSGTAPPGRWMTPAEALEGARAPRGSTAVRGSQICFLK